MHSVSLAYDDAAPLDMSAEIPDWKDYKSAKVSTKKYKHAAAFLASKQAILPEKYLRTLTPALNDSGANYHIFNDLEYFQGFKDLTNVNLSVTTGGGKVACRQMGTATFLTIDRHGREVLIICEGALYVPSCPFCIISQNRLQSPEHQCLASFYAPVACDNSSVQIRCTENCSNTVIDLHRIDGLDFFTACCPGTLNSRQREEIKHQADLAKEINIKEKDTISSISGNSSFPVQPTQKTPTASAQAGGSSRKLLDCILFAGILNSLTKVTSPIVGSMLAASPLTPAEIQYAQKHISRSCPIYNAPNGFAGTESHVPAAGNPFVTASLGNFAALPGTTFGAPLNYLIPDSSEYAAIHTAYTSQELHELLGHASISKIANFLKTTDAIRLKGSLKLDKCGICSQEKLTRSPPPSSTTLITDRGPNILYVDTKFPACGPSLGGATDCHDMLDHKTGLLRTFCVATKGNFLVVLQSAIQCMYTQYNRTLHVLCSDNAPEFGRGLTGDEQVIKFMLDSGIKPQSSAPYQHEESGAVERAHRTLDEAMRSRLSQSGCPAPFWALARHHACQVINVLPNRRATQLWASMGHSGPCSAIGAINGTGRTNAWWIQPFGCRCYARPPGDQKLPALARRGLPGIFVGYADHMDSKGYAIYIPGRDQLLISSNATFHQKEFPFMEGAVQWNDKTRQGEWATGFQEPRHVLDSVISESNTYNKFQQQTGGNKDFTWQTNLDSPSLVPLSTLVDPNDEPLTQHQRQSPHKNLSYKTSGSTKGHVQAIRPSSAEIRIWANDNITCEFLQENPKRDNSKSALRYDTYKHCLSISQFLEEFPNLISDFINDYSKGYIKCDKIAAVHFAHAIPTSFPVYTPKLQLDSVQGPCVLESGGSLGNINLHCCSLFYAFYL